MSHISVLIASTVVDAKAEVIAERVAARTDMTLLGGRVLRPADVGAYLTGEPPPANLAAIVVGPPAETRPLAERWLARRADLVVMLVDLVDDVIRIQGITLRDPRLDALLTALHEVVERVGSGAAGRVMQVDLASELPPSADVRTESAAADTAAHDAAPAIEDACEAPVPPAPPAADGGHDAACGGPADRPLLAAAINWLYHVLRDAVVAAAPPESTDEGGVSVTVNGMATPRKALLQSLDRGAVHTADGKPAGAETASQQLDDQLAAAMARPDEHCEPLAVAARAFQLNAVEFRLIVLALAPEIDLLFQRCLGFLLEEIGRRVGNFALYAELLAADGDLRDELSRTGTLDRWLVFDAPIGQRPAADEPLRLDPFLARWLLGECDALEDDPRLRRVMRLDPWPGAALLRRAHERCRAEELLRHISAAERWLVLDRADHPGWRALIELAAHLHRRRLLRIEAAKLHGLAGLDGLELDEIARRIARASRCPDRLLVVDTVKAESLEGHEEWLAAFIASLSRAHCRAVLLCANEARLVGYIGGAPFQLLDEEPLSPEARIATVSAAAEGAEVYLTADDARAMASRFPLRIDALEEAMRLARSRPLDYTQDDPRLARFTAVCKELSARGLSHFAERLDPIFDLDDVILPPDRKSQLIEIVDNVRLAHVVLDEWKFGARLPYGRGVAALLYGPSGTGKTMAAIAIARRLDVEILHLDLSRVVSKYIGDTEKHIDRVFRDAQHTGAAILIDEADALFGKRTEVKDAHDKFANVECAYILQRLDSFDGLTLLTSNMRQSLDPAFIRRLRFIIEFPRPDVDARERIWRQCLPAGTHTLSDAVFRQLARKVDVTGGNIRQITLRAAFMAAAAGTRIGVEPIVQATRAELAKIGLPAVDLDLTQARAA